MTVPASIPGMTPPLPANPVKQKGFLQGMVDDNIEKQYDGFLKMFLATIQHPNPENPPEAMEMSKTIMGFVSATEHSKTNKQLADLSAHLKMNEVYQAQSIVTKNVEFNADFVDFHGVPENIAFELPPGTRQYQLALVDRHGQIVKTFQSDPNNIADTKPGYHTVTWTGDTDDGQSAVPHGIYGLRLEALNAAGGVDALQTRLTGAVDSCTTDENGDMLYHVRGHNIRQHDVKRIKGDANHHLTLEKLKDIQALIEQVKNAPYSTLNTILPTTLSTGELS